MTPKITTFTVSYAFDTRGPTKSSHFVSCNFALPEPMEPADLDIHRLEASAKVSTWAIQDAIMRGDIGIEEAKERLDTIKTNLESMKSTLIKRKGESK